MAQQHDEDEVQKMKQLEIKEGRSRKYHFHFIGTVKCYENMLELDQSEFKEKILDLFDIAYDDDLKELKIEADDETNEEHHYKITCGFHLKTKMDPNVYINDEFDRIVGDDDDNDDNLFLGAIYWGFDELRADFIGHIGKFKRLHQKDYKPKRKKENHSASAKGLNAADLEEEEKRRELIRHKKELELQSKAQRDRKKKNQHDAVVQEYADTAYEHDPENPNYQKINGADPNDAAQGDEDVLD